MTLIADVRFYASKHKIVTSELLDTDVSAPAPLNLPFGKLFFGFKVVPYQPPEAKDDEQQVRVFLLPARHICSCPPRTRSLKHLGDRVLR